MNERMNDNSYAPIVVFAYKRFFEYKKLIESLQKNNECKYSDLFIFIDGIKNEKEEENNTKIYEYSKNIDGFRNVFIEKSKINKGLANSVINGVSNVINKYGKVIVLEDDLEVSNTFLAYMNSSLDYYHNQEKVFSIAGYCPNISIKNDNVFFFPRIESWGWATWDNRWNKVDWNVSDYNEFIKNKKLIKEFNKGGNDLSEMLKQQHLGEVDSWAIRFCYSEFIDKSFTVYPPKSLVANNGCNLNGTNFKEVNTRYDVKIADNYSPILKEFNGIMNNYGKMLAFYNCSRMVDLFNKIVNKLKRFSSKGKE